MILPLVLTEPLGSVGYKDKPVFDEKLAEREEYRYGGKNGGIAWKRKVENHFISRAPVMQGVLAWGEEEERGGKEPLKRPLNKHFKGLGKASLQGL